MRFGERLEKAAAALEEAWKLDPADSEAATAMITGRAALVAETPQ